MAAINEGGNNMNENTKNVIKSGIFFGIVMGVVFSFLNDVFTGIIGGIISGVCYGVLMDIFMKRMAKKFEKSKPQIVTDKLIVMEGPANHFKGIEGVGGWIFLTTDELIFKSHLMNIQNHELIIPLNQIIEIRAVLTLGIIANGLKIITVDNKSERFVVNSPKIWVQKIKGTKSTIM